MDDTPKTCQLPSDTSDVPKATERRSQNRSTGAAVLRQTAMRRLTGRSFCGVEEKPYTADEVEFMLAIDKYKREKHRPFPTCSEILSVARSLGYRKE